MAEEQPDGVLPELERLHERHGGLTEHQCGSNAECARVCLAWHQRSPTTFEVSVDKKRVRRELTWRAPDERALAAHANPANAKEYGAYSIAAAAVECEFGRYFARRTSERSGTDWYIVARHSSRDIEDAWVLEVTGTASADQSYVNGKLGEKVQQIVDGGMDCPGLACVVDFRRARIVMATVGDGHARD